MYKTNGENPLDFPQHPVDFAKQIQQLRAGALVNSDDGGYSLGNRQDYDAAVKQRNYSLAEARVRDLAALALDQAVPYTWHHLNRVQVDEVMQAFLKLLVTECVGVVADAVEGREPASTYVNKIKQHFGLET